MFWVFYLIPDGCKLQKLMYGNTMLLDISRHFISDIVNSFICEANNCHSGQSFNKVFSTFPHWRQLSCLQEYMSSDSLYGSFTSTCCTNENTVLALETEPYICCLLIIVFLLLRFKELMNQFVFIRHSSTFI